MIIAPTPCNESERLKDLASFDIVKAPTEKEFGSIAELASQIGHTPVSLVTIIDKDTQWNKARKGLDLSSVPRELSICSHAIMQDDIMVVENMLQDERFYDHPFVQSVNGFRFYAAAPIISPKGFKLGTVSILDYRPRTLSRQDQLSLQHLSTMVTHLLELRQKNILLRQKTEEYIALKSIAAQTYVAQTELSKKRMASELHENTAQSLASVLMMLKVAGGRSGQDIPEISDVQQILIKTLGDIKSHAFKLTPLSIVGMHSSEVITEYIKQLSSTYPFHIHVDQPTGDSHMQPEVLLVATRIAEQWMNMLSQKPAISDVRISVHVKDMLHIEINDNEPECNLESRRNDLIKNILLDELYSIGGQIDISVSDKHKNLIIIHAPLKSELYQLAV